MAKKNKNVATRTFIKERRKAVGVTQERVAEALELTQGQYSRLERGISDPTVSQLRTIAGVLHCEIEALLRDPTKQNSLIPIAEKVPQGERDRAARILEAFIQKQ